MSTQNPPDCRRCKWSRREPSGAHLCCMHPATELLWTLPGSRFVYVMGKGAGIVDYSEQTKGLYVVGDETGKAIGAFNWPFNFDPLWLQECDGWEMAA